MAVLFFNSEHATDSEMTDQRRFETTSLPLAASLLVAVPGSSLTEISSEPSIDGKRLFIVAYPPEQTQAVRDLVERFHGRRLVVPLYVYNRVLNTLRDRLKQDTGHHAL